jgi:hypothetical protein
MALTNYEKQKRWREKNKALYNLRQREYRRGKTVGAGDARLDSETEPPAKSKIDQLRELIATESAKPPEMAVGKPLIFRDDYGRVINESQWKRLQERKTTAKSNGYEHNR